MTWCCLPRSSVCVCVCVGVDGKRTIPTVIQELIYLFLKFTNIIQGMLLIKTYTDQHPGPTMDLHFLKYYRKKYGK